MSHLSRSKRFGLVFFTALFLSGNFGAIATAATTDVKATSPFCSNLSTSTAKIATDLNNLKGKLATTRTDQDGRVAERRQKWDTELGQARTNADTKRQESFAKLEAKATTEAQKSAVKVYQQAITLAVATRRAGNDAARLAFRGSVDAAREARRKTVDGQVVSFQTSVNTASSTALVSCVADDSAKNGAVLREAYIASLKTARSTFREQRKSDNKIGDDVKDFAATRAAAIKTTNTAFLASIKVARETLKKAYGDAEI